MLKIIEFTDYYGVNHSIHNTTLKGKILYHLVSLVTKLAKDYKGPWDL